MNAQSTPPVAYLTGDNAGLLVSVAVCLITGGSGAIVNSVSNIDIQEEIDRLLAAHFQDNAAVHRGKLRFTNNAADAVQANVSIVLTSEDLQVKRSAIKKIEEVVSRTQPILCTIEGIPLEDLQTAAAMPERIIGVNWSEPVYTSGFMEIIANATSQEGLANNIQQMAIAWWRKDPYIITAGYSVRARLMCSILREAFFLLENKYADFEDIDRACRNDAGYYLAFAGNFRYMDLMGLYAYGQVMKDLNRELSTDTRPPAFFTEMVQRKEFGMDSGKGFYQYQNGDAKSWKSNFEEFSFEIDKIIRKYPVKMKSED